MGFAGVDIEWGQWKDHHPFFAQACSAVGVWYGVLGLLDMLALHVLFGVAGADSRANNGLYEYKCDRHVGVIRLIMKERTRQSVIGLVEITHYWY